MRATVRLALRFPRLTLLVAVALAVASLVVTGTQLGFHTSRHELVSADADYNRLWLEYVDEFGDQDDAVVVVEGDHRDQVTAVLAELTDVLEQEPRWFQAILHQVDLSRIRGKALHYVPYERLLEIEQFATQARPVLEGDWTRLQLTHLLSETLNRSTHVSDLGFAAQRERAEESLVRLADSLLAALSGPGRYQSPWESLPDSIHDELHDRYLLSVDGRLGFIRLRLAESENRFARYDTAIARLRERVDEVQSRHPEVSVGLTGLPIMENDEMRSSQKATTRASLLSLLGVGCLFVAGLGGIRHPLMTVAALVIGLAWSFGYLTLAIGHLNILSVSFSVILIGLGIDFGIHYVARYLQIRRHNPDCQSALEQTNASVGAGITTGAVTTAIAFFMARFTPFTGVAELGVIAGGGILLCGVVALVVLPVIILLADRHHDNLVTPEPLAVDQWIAPFVRYPRFVFAATAALTLFLATGMVRLSYDHNLLNLQAEDLESVALERKLLAQTRQSAWYALSIADSREELLGMKEQFQALDSVERVEEIVSWLPTDAQRKCPVIETISGCLESCPDRPPIIPVDHPADVARTLAALSAQLKAQDFTRAADGLERVNRALGRLSPEQAYARLAEFQQRLAGDLLGRLKLLSTISNPEAPQLSDLPPALVERFVSPGGKHLLMIYGQGDIWDMDALGRFVRDVRNVDPAVTGHPLQAYEASLEMKQSYQLAAIYAFAAILVVLLIDLRSWPMTLLTLVPVVLGMVQLFGLMGLLDMPLNPANMIVLPLILGIGVDDGVHVVHDFRQQTGRYQISSSTAAAVLITSLTTMVGFGTLMIADHRGLQSLGRVLALGVSCCLFSSLVILPALLTWMTRSREEEDGAQDDASPETEEDQPLLHRLQEPRPEDRESFVEPRRRAA